jgi:hypothetical protein
MGGAAANAEAAIPEATNRDGARRQGPASPPSGADPKAGAAAKAGKKLKEIGGPKGPEPTRYGDWERGGRCIDF